MTARQEVLERVFNALWRENFAAGKRLSGICRRGVSCAVITLPGGAELLAHLRGRASYGLLRTEFPYYVRLPESQGPEEIDSTEELLDLLPDETGMLELLSNEWLGKMKTKEC
mgnify:CR=1 FL=1